VTAFANPGMRKITSCVLFAILALLPVQGYVYERSDRSGTYTYDRYGHKTYSHCFDRYARPEDNCRNYRRGYDGSRYDRDRYDRDRDYYSDLRGKVNVGKGVFREINGRDAELTCEFPRGSHLISNIVWERVGDRSYSRLRDRLGRKMEVEEIGDYGSVLIIRDWDERDTGVYRCVATRTYNPRGYSYRRTDYERKEIVYMEVEFYPDRRSYRSRNDYAGYNDYFSRDYYRDRDRQYYPNTIGWFRTAAAQTLGDKVVVDENVEEEKTSKEKNNDN